MDPINYIWQDRKRYFGRPMSFTKYALSEDRFFVEKGFLSMKQDEILLYRVVDLELTISLFQRFFNVGTIAIRSSDKSIPHLLVINVKDPRDVKEMIHKAVEECKMSRGVTSMEMVGGNH